MELTVRATREADGRQVLTLVGSLDLASKAAVLKAGRAALAGPGTTALVLDLAGVTFMDSTGIGLLVDLGHDAEDAQLGFALREPASQVRRVLQITGLLGAWPIEEPSE